MAAIHLTIVTPQQKAFDSHIESLTAPGMYGSFGVLHDHAPMIVGLKPGLLTATEDGKTSFFVVGEGVLEVSFGNEVVALVDSVKSAESKEQAQELLAARKA